MAGGSRRRKVGSRAGGGRQKVTCEVGRRDDAGKIWQAEGGRYDVTGRRW